MRSLLLRVVAVTVLAGGLALFGGSPAAACSCPAAATGDQYAQSDVVVTGTVTRSKTSAPGVERYRVTLEQIHKGHPVGLAIDVASSTTGPEGKVDRTDAAPPCGLQRVQDGRRYVVFAEHPTGTPSGLLWAYRCGGSRQVTPELTAELDRLSAAAELQPLVFPVETAAPPDPPDPPPPPSGSSGWLLSLASFLTVLGAGSSWLLWRRQALPGPAAH